MTIEHCVAQDLQVRYPSLSSNQARFFALLDRVPQYLRYWDIDYAEYDVAAVEMLMEGGKHSQLVMMAFLLGVWRGDNSFQFDLLDAVDWLDEAERSVIVDWLRDPFWP